MFLDFLLKKEKPKRVSKLFNRLSYISRLCEKIAYYAEDEEITLGAVKHFSTNSLEGISPTKYFDFNLSANSSLDSLKDCRVSFIKQPIGAMFGVIIKSNIVRTTIRELTENKELNNLTFIKISYISEDNIKVTPTLNKEFSAEYLMDVLEVIKVELDKAYSIALRNCKTHLTELEKLKEM